MNPSGLVGVCTGNTFLSKCIQYFRKGIVYDDKSAIPTHIFIVFGDLLGEIIIGEATDPVIRLAPLSKYLKKSKHKKIELYEIPNLNMQIVEEALKELLPMVGKYYGFKQLIGYLWIWMGHQFGKQWHNLFKDDGEMVCSYYGFQFLKKIDYQDTTLMIMKNNDVAPDNILKSMQKKCKLIAISDFDQEDITWL